MKWQWWLIISVLLIGIILLVGWLEFGWFKKQNGDAPTIRELEKAARGVNFPLKNGNINEAIGLVQEYLNSTDSQFDCPKINRDTATYKNKKGEDKPVWPVEVDNIFGPQVTQALRLCYNTETVSKEQYDNLITKF